MQLFLKLFLPVLCLFAACSGRDNAEFIEDRTGLVEKDARVRMEKYHRVLLSDLEIHFKLVVKEGPAFELPVTNYEPSSNKA